MHNLDKFIKENKEDMLEDLKHIINNCKGMIYFNQDWYTEPGCDGPSIDVRLCIDNGTWIFRTGSSDYDQRHSQYCSASSIDLDTNPEKLLEYLINDLFA